MLNSVIDNSRVKNFNRELWEFEFLTTLSGCELCNIRKLKWSLKVWSTKISSVSHLFVCVSLILTPIGTGSVLALESMAAVHHLQLGYCSRNVQMVFTRYSVSFALPEWKANACWIRGGTRTGVPARPRCPHLSTYSCLFYGGKQWKIGSETINYLFFKEGRSGDRDRHLLQYLTILLQLFRFSI